MVALAILSVAILMLTYLGSSFTLTRNAQIDTQAQAYARSYFDSLRAVWANEAAFERGVLPSLPLPSGFSGLELNVEEVEALGQRVVLRRVSLSFSGPQGRAYRFTTEVVRPPL
jgi:hypothetical protein